MPKLEDAKKVDTTTEKEDAPLYEVVTTTKRRYIKVEALRLAVVKRTQQMSAANNGDPTGDGEYSEHSVKVARALFEADNLSSQMQRQLQKVFEVMNDEALPTLYAKSTKGTTVLPGAVFYLVHESHERPYAAVGTAKWGYVQVINAEGYTSNNVFNASYTRWVSRSDGHTPHIRPATPDEALAFYNVLPARARQKLVKALEGETK